MSDKRQTDELGLIRRVGAGDKAAFREIYDAYEKRVFFFIKRRLGDPHEAADVFHDVMMDVWRQASRFEGRSKVTTWIFGIAHNKSVDALRKRGGRVFDELDEEAKDDAPTAADLVEVAGDAAVVRGCVNELKPVAREVITLAFFEGLKYREIAEAMECPEGTIKARAHRAMKEIEACVQRCGLSKAKDTGT
ncbi:MAG: RNA polymerase sigma factor [Neomegalonema sp.]|nr:RNA polymerase sigma factor [Neomegalonema sp.]